jgi:hypothetical protein
MVNVSAYAPNSVNVSDYTIQYISTASCNTVSWELDASNQLNEA